MVVGGDTRTDTPVGSEAPASEASTPPSWWSQRGNLLVLVALATAAVGAVLVLRSPGLPDARPLGRPGWEMADAPDTAVVQRWTLDLGSGDPVGLVEDRVVVVEEPTGSDETDVTARHVRSRAVLWERRLPGRSLVMMVDERGSTTTLRGTMIEPREEGQRLVALAADDGRVLWERAVLFVDGASSGHVLLTTETECELVDALTGDTILRADGHGCRWVDDDEVAVRSSGGWDFRGVDGAVTVASVPGDEPPTPVGEDVATIVDGQLRLYDRTGQVRWSAPTTLMTGPGEQAWIMEVPDRGVLVSAWDAEAQATISEAWDLDGTPMDVGTARLEEALLFLDIDGRPFAVREEAGEAPDLYVAPVDDLGREVGRMSSSEVVGIPIDITRRGVLARRDGGTTLELRAWPDLEPAWSVRLPPTATDDGGWTEVQSSRFGLVVIPGSERTLYAYG